MSKKIEMRYGKGKIAFEIPEKNILQIIEPTEVTGVNDADLEIEHAIKNPIGSKLDEIVNSKDRVAIIVPDQTRYSKSIEKIARALLKKLLELGVGKNNIFIIVGQGAHRKPTEKEIAHLLGTIPQEFKVYVHDPLDKNLTFVGRTSYGTEVWVNSLVYNADKKISIGLIAPHPFAGYTGGSKSILPGVCGIKTIKQNHSWLIHSRAKSGLSKGNPVFEDIIEGAKMVGLDFIVNIVVNHKDHIIKAVAGDFIKAHKEGAKISDAIYRAPIKEKADIVIASAGGYPIDSTLQLSMKSLENAILASKDDGVIILATACEEGTGLEIFFPEKDPFQEIIVAPVHEFARAIKIPQFLFLVTELSEGITKKLLLRKAPITEALDWAFLVKGKDAKAIIMPYAWRTEPVIS
ncbi:MAG: nickel-dependent lactate racemase [Euryarchaeota archaeon]|nr:nickel-dependent lactate racemase [Euryarchaeota archaeon]